MINLITSIYTILKLLYKSDMCLKQEGSKLKILFHPRVEVVELLTWTLILNYKQGFIGCDQNPEEILKTQETLNSLDDILKELNITHSCK